MKVLVSKIFLIIPYSSSLKDKRRIIKAIKDRIWVKFRVSISEIDDLNSIKNAVLGISYVSNNTEILDSIINKIINFVEESYPGILYNYNYTIENF